MITRFAPSPTGPLHLGHAFSALTAYSRARLAGGQFLLRIEDIDQSRARPEWEAQIYDDLNWLGLHWSSPVMRQSDRFPVYSDALDVLWKKGLLYPCSCRRKDIQAAASAPQEGVAQFGPDGIVYPGTCRNLPRPTERPRDAALRLDIGKAMMDKHEISFEETGAEHRGNHKVSRTDFIAQIGDVVLSRRDMGTSYHLSVVVDDAAQGITEVVRGRDLFEATAIHVLLQNLLDLPVPSYHHHHLIRDETGKRLAKRDDARAIATYRADGLQLADIRNMIGL